MSYLMNMISIRHAVKPMQIHEDPRRLKNRRLDKLQSALDRNSLAIAEPSSSHGLMPIGPLNGRTCHSVTPMLRGIFIVNGNRSADDGATPR